MTVLDSIDKTQVLAALRSRLEQELHAAFEAQQRTREGATHEESRPENDRTRAPSSHPTWHVARPSACSL